jgi:quinol monooxygenase YgiN
MGLCLTRDMPPPYNEQSDIDKIKYITAEAKNKIKSDYTMKSIEHRMKTIDIIDKLILEAANKGYNILNYEYHEPNDSKKHNFFIELRYDSVKHILKHYKSKKYKIDYFIFDNIHIPVKIYIKW